MQIGGIGFGHLRISSKKWRNHSISSRHLSNAINSDFIVDLAITVCFEDFHETAPPPSVNIKPLWDFEILTFDIQFASL